LELLLQSACRLPAMAAVDNLVSMLKFGHQSRKCTANFIESDLKEFDLSLDILQKAYDVKTARPETYKGQAAGVASLAAKCLSAVLKKNGIDTAELDGMIEIYDDFLTVHSFVMAFAGSTVASAATCAAAWGGANVAQVAVKGLRGLDPNLQTDAATQEIENAAFSKIGGGAAVCAAGGLAAGAVAGPVGAAVGAALGGAAGSVMGAISFATQGPPPPADGCIFYVEDGKVDVKVIVWGPGGGMLGYDYKKHNEFKIKPGSHFIEKCDKRNIQLVVNGKWHDLKDVIRTYKAIGIADDGSVQKVTR